MALGLVFLCITALLFKIAGIIGHLFFMSSVARVQKLSLSGLLLYWLCIADQVFVQWLQLQKKHPQARYVGCLAQLICSTSGTDMMAHAYIPVLSNPGLRMKSQMLLIIAVFMMANSSRQQFPKFPAGYHHMLSITPM